jgi:hypothetical protein
MVKTATTMMGWPKNRFGSAAGSGPGCVMAGRLVAVFAQLDAVSRFEAWDGGLHRSGWMRMHSRSGVEGSLKQRGACDIHRSPILGQDIVRWTDFVPISR